MDIVLAARPAPGPAEYAVAVQRYLERACLSPASRRVYAISLSGWAWPLTGRPVPARRRGARPPAVPLALLDDPRVPGRLAAAVAGRQPRTRNREISALRSAAWWWLEQGWIAADPTAGLRLRTTAGAARPRLSDGEFSAVLGLGAGLREQALWRLLRDSGWPAGQALALDAAMDLAIPGLAIPGLAIPDRARGAARPWRPETGRLLSLLLAGRPCGPLFLTGRRAPAGTPAADICPVTSRARMSYRRAAEIFTARTRPLDPSGRGWTLHQLSAARVGNAQARGPVGPRG